MEGLRFPHEDSGEQSCGPDTYPGYEIDQEHYRSREGSQGFQEDSISQTSGSSEREETGSDFRDLSISNDGEQSGRRKKDALLKYQNTIFSPNAQGKSITAPNKIIVQTNQRFETRSVHHEHLWREHEIIRPRHRTSLRYSKSI